MAENTPNSSDFAIPDALPVLPLREAVVFPLTAAPLLVGQPRSLRLVDDVMRGNRLLALVAQRNPAVEQAAAGDLHRIGTVAVIHQAPCALRTARLISVRKRQQRRCCRLVSAKNLDVLLSGYWASCETGQRRPKGVSASEGIAPPIS
jgi:ATP-dependent Lon protease